MANLQANLRSQCALAVEEPERLLRSINRLFFENTPESAYATLFYSEYDDKAGRLRYANCGHLAALVIRRDNSVERLIPPERYSACSTIGIVRFAKPTCLRATPSRFTRTASPKPATATTRSMASSASSIASTGTATFRPINLSP